MLNGSSIFDLFKDLKEEAKIFLREEVHLAKAELSEKFSRMGKESVNIAIGGIVAYAGLIVFLGALGMLIAFALRQIGLDPFLSSFIGLGAIGFIVIAVGALMLLGGLKALKKESLTPERAIESLQRVKGTKHYVDKPTAPKAQKDERSSKEIEASVCANRISHGRDARRIGRSAQHDPFAAAGEGRSPETSVPLEPGRDGRGRLWQLYHETQAGPVEAKTVMSPKKFWLILKGTFAEFSEDNVLRLSAALSYYSIFSIGPLLVIVVGLVGLAFGHDTVRHQIERELQSMLGPNSAQDD